MINGSIGLQIAKIFIDHSFVLHFAGNSKDFSHIQSQISFFDPGIRVIFFPHWDIEPYSRASPNPKITGSRLEALFHIKKNINQKVLLLGTPEALMQKIPPIDDVLNSVILLYTKDSLDRNALISSLFKIGYRRSPTAESPGEFAVRGGIVDLVDHHDMGYRIDFFGSVIDSIKIYDPETQITRGKVDELVITPISEIILDDHNINEFKDNYLKRFGIKDDPLYHEAINGSRYSGAENWLPIFYSKLETILSHCPKHGVISSSTNISQELNDFEINIKEHYNARISDKSYNPLDPRELYTDKEAALKDINTFNNYASSIVFEPANHLLYNIKNKNDASVIDAFKLYAEGASNKICIACNSEGSLDRIGRMLQLDDIEYKVISSYQELLSSSFNTISLSLISLDNGFIYQDITFFSESDLFGRKLIQKPKKKKNTIKFFQEFNTIEVGELLVHLEYGIGRFQGLKTIVVEKIAHDFVEIIYADGDKLYLPVENLEMISRYGEENGAVALDKLGTAGWQYRKAKLKERIKLAAESLLKTAAERETAAGFILEPIQETYDQFLSRFPYITTEDQESAIQDVLEDLASGKPMDRLICADVGFGKTEVALRAACIATLGTNPVQVAVVVPTTLLARQHYNTFLDRFKGLPVNIKQLSKFTPKKDIQGIKEDLKKGLVDIVIGTHSLLAKDIGFKKLGLIIIDEEQHFGVAQKEKLKNLKSDVHVLTLSATPIPRTLQMALVDIKSLSIIATPPTERIPVKTSIIPYDTITLRDALYKEKARAGLSFYVTPRISYLDEIEEKLNTIAPDLKITKAHGALPSAQLDQIMNDFYDHKFDVLLSTSIIESGLDVQSANTIIVDRAHMFGLSQLYQMKGRVGRAGISAYAFFITPKDNILSPIAKKRMSILQSLQSLGSGFTVASHDMDTRGYGNLLGDEQSGHIKEVGIELYQKMLADIIESMQSGQIASNRDWSPVINLGVSVQLPENYISDANLRLSLYRQIADINEEIEADRFAAEIIDRFGKLPEEAEHLFDIIKMKQLAKKANIMKIDSGDKGLVFSFKDLNIVDHAKIIKILSDEKEYEAKLKPDGKLLFLLRFTNQKYDRMKSAKRILSELAYDNA